MSKVSGAQGFTADEAIAIYEDSISYYVPATFEADANEAAVDDSEVVYYEAA